MKYTPSRFLTEPYKREFGQVSEALKTPTVQAMFLAQLNTEPARYGDGMMVYADGTNWDPGSGEGVYCYYATGWNYLG